MKLLAALFVALAFLGLSACQSKPEIEYVPQAVFPKPPEILMREPIKLAPIIQQDVDNEK